MFSFWREDLAYIITACIAITYLPCPMFTYMLWHFSRRVLSVLLEGIAGGIKGCLRKSITCLRTCQCCGETCGNGEWRTGWRWV